MEVNGVQYEVIKYHGVGILVSIKLDLNDIKRLQAAGPQYKPVIELMNSKDNKKPQWISDGC